MCHGSERGILLYVHINIELIHNLKDLAPCSVLQFLYITVVFVNFLKSIYQGYCQGFDDRVR